MKRIILVLAIILLFTGCESVNNNTTDNAEDNKPIEEIVKEAVDLDVITYQGNLYHKVENYSVPSNTLLNILNIIREETDYYDAIANKNRPSATVNPSQKTIYSMYFINPESMIACKLDDELSLYINQRVIKSENEIDQVLKVDWYNSALENLQIDLQSNEVLSKNHPPIYIDDVKPMTDDEYVNLKSSLQRIVPIINNEYLIDSQLALTLNDEFHNILYADISITYDNGGNEITAQLSRNDRNHINYVEKNHYGVSKQWSKQIDGKIVETSLGFSNFITLLIEVPEGYQLLFLDKDGELSHKTIIKNTFTAGNNPVRILPSDTDEFLLVVFGKNQSYLTRYKLPEMKSVYEGEENSVELSNKLQEYLITERPIINMVTYDNLILFQYSRVTRGTHYTDFDLYNNKLEHIYRLVANEDVHPISMIYLDETLKIMFSKDDQLVKFKTSDLRLDAKRMMVNGRSCLGDHSINISQNESLVPFRTIYDRLYRFTNNQQIGQTTEVDFIFSNNIHYLENIKGYSVGLIGDNEFYIKSTIEDDFSGIDDLLTGLQSYFSSLDIYDDHSFYYINKNNLNLYHVDMVNSAIKEIPWFNFQMLLPYKLKDNTKIRVSEGNDVMANRIIFYNDQQLLVLEENNDFPIYKDMQYNQQVANYYYDTNRKSIAKQIKGKSISYYNTKTKNFELPIYWFAKNQLSPIYYKDIFYAQKLNQNYVTKSEVGHFALFEGNSLEIQNGNEELKIISSQPLNNSDYIVKSEDTHFIYLANDKEFELLIDQPVRDYATTDKGIAFTGYNDNAHTYFFDFETSKIIQLSNKKWANNIKASEINLFIQNVDSIDIYDINTLRFINSIAIVPNQELIFDVETFENGDYLALKYLNDQDITIYTVDGLIPISRIKGKSINNFAFNEGNLYYSDSFLVKQNIKSGKISILELANTSDIKVFTDNRIIYEVIKDGITTYTDLPKNYTLIPSNERYYLFFSKNADQTFDFRILDHNEHYFNYYQTFVDYEYEIREEGFFIRGTINENEVLKDKDWEKLDINLSEGFRIIQP